MKEIQVLKLLHDMKIAMDSIHIFCVGKTKTDYLEQLLLRSAVERQLEIVGEALSQIKKIDTAILIRIRESQKIIAFRNILVHAYATIDSNISWDIVENKIPILQKEVENLIEFLTSRNGQNY